MATEQTTTTLILFFAKILVPFLIIFQIIPLLVWLERKACAFVQDRHGPNRAAIFGIRLGGLLHALADVVKLLSKHDVIPKHVNKPLFILAPMISLFVACVTFVVIPFAAPIEIAGHAFAIQAAPAPVGILYILALTSMGVYGIMLAGWSSNNKYALLGTLRSAAQLVSYEIGMGLALLSVFILSGSVEIGEIVANQGAMPWNWNVVRQPLACLLFIVCAFAETNRTPFDLPEGESEIVAGYHLEYSSMKFAMFFMAEYANMIIASALIASLFFGGFQVPFLSTETLRSLAAGSPLHLDAMGAQVFAAVVQFSVFLGKILFFCFFFILVRWTVPRFRYDQLMDLGWKGMIPLGLANLALTASVVYAISLR